MARPSPASISSASSVVRASPASPCQSPEDEPPDHRRQEPQLPRHGPRQDARLVARRRRANSAASGAKATSRSATSFSARSCSCSLMRAGRGRRCSGSRAELKRLARAGKTFADIDVAEGAALERPRRAPHREWAAAEQRERMLEQRHQRGRGEIRSRRRRARDRGRRRAPSAPPACRQNCRSPRS